MAACCGTYAVTQEKYQSLSPVQLFAAPRTEAHQDPLSVEFSGQEYRSGLPCPSPGDRPHPGTEPGSPSLRTDSSLSEPPGTRGPCSEGPAPGAVPCRVVWRCSTLFLPWAWQTVQPVLDFKPRSRVRAGLRLQRPLRSTPSWPGLAHLSGDVVSSRGCLAVFSTLHPSS